MLDIGRLSPGAADYYLGEVASSAEDYYTGRGESEGRWVGSLAESIGLRGKVSGPAFRAVLEGRHPVTDEQLVRRPRFRGPAERVNPDQLHLVDDDEFDLARVAARLQVGIRRVRQLIWTGDRKQDAPDDFLLARRGPSTGGRPPWLVRRSEVERFEAAATLRKGRPGFDVTLRPPKSVSLLWALGTPEVRDAVRQAHADSVDAVVDYLETHAVYGRRRSESGQDPIETDGIIAAAFDHRTSRAGDPLLHTHVVTANLTRSVEGRWQALDARPLYSHARPAGVLYNAHLRHLLTERLGVRWEGVRKGWAEIDGIPKDVIRAFSKRRDEIEEMVAESGYTSARAHQAATLATRRPKQHGVSPDALLQNWRDEATGLGFGPEQVALCLGRNPSPQSERPLEEWFAELAGPQGLTRHSSTFARKEVVEALAERVGSSASATAIDQAADLFLATAAVQSLFPAKGSKEWVWRRGGAKERDIDLVSWSTPELLAMERDLLRWSENGFGEPPRTPDAAAVEAALASRPFLSDEQRNMVRSLSAPSSLSIQTVEGRPGSGKTTATAVYVEALAASGVPVVGCAVAATAAGELERACDFGARTGREASTLARLLIELESHPLPPGTVVVLDEASMVATRDLYRLARHVASAGGALKLIGDPDQHGAVETGGAFRALVRNDDQGIALKENNRQLDPSDRDAIDHFREGNVEAALSRYDDAGRIVRSPSAKESYRRIVDDWWASVVDGGSDPMIAGTNAVRFRLNAQARARMAENGRLTGDQIDNGDGTKLACGDWVVARRNNRRLQSASGGWVKNGSAGRVVATDSDSNTITVSFESEGDIRLPRWYIESGWIQHAYARTTYGVQGATLEHAFVHVDDRTGFEEGYVALTRGRRDTTLYLVDGTLTDESDVTHAAHERPDTGLDTVAKSMEERRAGELAHERDAHAVDASLAFAGWDLRELRRERRRLEDVLTSGPPSVERELRDAVSERDAIVTRLKARSETSRGGRETRRVVDSLRHIDGKIARLTARHDEHRQFIDQRSDVVERLEQARHAELAREASLRAEARANFASVLGPAHRTHGIGTRAELAAAELAAVHLERFGRIDADARDAVTHILGAKPATRVEARLSYERAVEALRVALDLRDVAPAPTVADVEPPSLFD